MWTPSDVMPEIQDWFARELQMRLDAALRTRDHADAADTTAAVFDAVASAAREVADGLKLIDAQRHADHENPAAVSEDEAEARAVSAAALRSSE